MSIEFTNFSTLVQDTSGNCRLSQVAAYLVQKGRCVRFIVGALALAISLVDASSAFADVSINATTGLRIEQPRATSGTIGSTSILSFKVVNENSVALHLVTVSTPVAKQAKLIAAVGNGKTVDLGSIAIPATETLDLTTTHLKYELSPLTKNLELGEEFPLKIIFSDEASRSRLTSMAGTKALSECWRNSVDTGRQ